MGVPKPKKREGRWKTKQNKTEEILAKDFPNLMKPPNPLIQEIHKPQPQEM